MNDANGFRSKNGTTFFYSANMIGQVSIPVLFPTTITKDECGLDVHINAEDLMEFVLYRLRAEEIIHFDDGETKDLIKYIGRRRKE